MSTKTIYIEEQEEISKDIWVNYYAEVKINRDSDYGADADGNRGRESFDYEVIKKIITCKNFISDMHVDFDEETEDDYLEDMITDQVSKAIENWHEVA